MVSIDFFTVPTATFRILFVLVILIHSRRRVVHFNVTAHPTANWTAQQIIEAFPWDTGPRFLLRDRDSIYGSYFQINGNRNRLQIGIVFNNGHNTADCAIGSRYGAEIVTKMGAGILGTGIGIFGDDRFCG